MRWRDISGTVIRSEEVASVFAEIAELRSRFGASYLLTVWHTIEGDSHSGSSKHATLDDAKAEALAAMRDEVIAARCEAENVVLDASEWLRENGGEP